MINQTKNIKINFKIVSWILFIGTIIFLLLSSFLLNEGLKKVFQILAGTLLVAMGVNFIAFWLNPELFQNKNDGVSK